MTPALLLTGRPPANAALARARRRRRQALAITVAAWAGLALLLAALDPRPTPDSERIVGRWAGVHEEHAVTVIFAADGAFQLQDEGPDFTLTTTFGRYSLTEEKQPTALTVHDVPGLDHALHTVIRFEGDDRLRVAWFSPLWRTRPIALDPARTLELYRIEE